MADVTPNGWTVVERDAMVDLVVAGVHFPNGVRRGPVSTVLQWVAEQHHARVERLVAGWCWGYHKKLIEGSERWSEHAAGNAIDINAPRHPMGVAPLSAGYTREQVAECHAIERESGGVVRWGGDFGRPDGMHWEIIGDSTEVARFAALIRERERQATVEVQEFFASVARGVSGTGASQADRSNRDNFAKGVRFALGMNADEQTSENMIDFKLDKIIQQTAPVEPPAPE